MNGEIKKEAQLESSKDQKPEPVGDLKINAPPDYNQGQSLKTDYIFQDIKRIESIKGFIMFKSGTATTAPTYIPRNFYESLVLKDDGTNRRLWVYINKVWRYVILT